MTTKEDIENNFSLVTNWVSENNMPATNEEKLICYGYFKQATIGDNTTTVPFAIQMEKKAKWNAWEKNKGISSEEAKKLYIHKIIELRNKYSL
jgi:diazepam-binding inhibitor (GABA receptor modulating acyl-CoA-binding protein)